MARALLAITHAHYDHSKWAPEFVTSAVTDHSTNIMPFYGSRHDFAVPMLGNKYELAEISKPDFVATPMKGTDKQVQEVKEERHFALVPFYGSKYEIKCMHGDELCPLSKEKNKVFILPDRNDERFMIPFKGNEALFTPLKRQKFTIPPWEVPAKRTKKFFTYSLKKEDNKFIVPLEGHNIFIIPYQKQGLVHSYSFGPISSLYVDCGEQRLNYEKQSQPKFLPHMHIEKVYLTVPTYFWLCMEGYYRGRWFPFYNLTKGVEVEFADFKKPFEFRNATLRAFPSTHSLGSMHFTYEKNGVKAVHLSDADYAEYTGFVSDLTSMGRPSGIASHLLDADYICLDASHMRSNYDKKFDIDKKIVEAVGAFRDGDFDYLSYAFFSPLNMFKYLEYVGLDLVGKKEAKTPLIFLNEKTYNHFRSFTGIEASEDLKLGKYLDDVYKKKYVKREKMPEEVPDLSEYLINAEPGAFEQFEHQLINFSKFSGSDKKKLKKLKSELPPRAVIFATESGHKFVQKLPKSFCINTRYDYGSANKKRISIVPQNHPDHDEIFDLLRLLTDPQFRENKKKGQVIILSSSNPKLPQDLLKERDFKKIIKSGREQGMRFLHASRDGDVEIID